MTRHGIALVALALAIASTRGGAQEITRLAGSGPSDLWGVTEGSSLLHLDGRSGRMVPTNMQVVIADVWSSGPRDAWAVGEQGTILRWDGAAWRPMASPVRKNLVRVSGCSAALVYVVAQSESDTDPAILLRWDGRTWTQTPINPPFRVSDLYLVCVAGAGGGEVAVSGFAHFDPVNTESHSAGVIARLRGGSWTTIGFDGQRATVPALFDLSVERYCAGAGATYAAIRRLDGSPALLRQSGATWSVLPSPDLPPGSDIVDATWVLARDCTPVVVFNQGIARFAAGQWQVVAPGVAAGAALSAQQQQFQQQVQGMNIQPGQMPTPEQMRQIQEMMMAQQAQQAQTDQTMQAMVEGQVWNFGPGPAVWAPRGADFFVATRGGRVAHVTGDSAVTVFDTICLQPSAADLPQCQPPPPR